MAPPRTFRYEAADSEGRPVTGTIDAIDEAEARVTLHAMQLSIIRLEPQVMPRSAPLRGDDLIAFNEQLAHLARAGLPVEAGLELLAADMSRGRLRDAIERLVQDISRGATLSDALATQRRAFPPLYVNLLEAGAKTGDLPGVLFNLTRHLELTRRLRGLLSRALAYPVTLLIALVLVSAFLSAYVLPNLLDIVVDRKLVATFSYGWRRPPPEVPTAPGITVFALWFGRIAPWVALALIAGIVAWICGWPLLRSTRLGRDLEDSVLTRLPLVGPVLRFSLVGRWCDAVRLGIRGGMDLPAAFSLASQTIHSERLSRDAATLTASLETGTALSTSAPLSILPRTVPATIDLAAKSGTLDDSLGSLADLYLRQAEQRARRIPLVLVPILIGLIALVITLLLAAIYLPITNFLRYMLGMMT